MAAWLDSKVLSFGNAFNDLTGVTGQNAANAQQAREMMASNAAQAREMMEFSSREAGLNRDWQAYMSGTAHRRETSDLQAAGLNRILSVSKGGPGASTPSGSMGQAAGFPAAGFPKQNNAGFFSTALEARRNHEEVKNLKETNTNIRADTDKKNSERALNSIMYNRVVHEVDTARAEKEIREASAKGAKVEGEIDEGKYGAALRYLDRIKGTASSASSAAQFLRYVR